MRYIIEYNIQIPIRQIELDFRSQRSVRNMRWMFQIVLFHRLISERRFVFLVIHMHQRLLQMERSV